MPVNLSIKNVPDEVVRNLRARAALNQRSLNEEVIDILREAARGQVPVSLDTLLARAQQKKPALEEKASLVLAAQEEQHKKTAQRFEDLLSRPDADTSQE